MLVAHYVDGESGAEAWLVVDTFLHGVAGGGIRMDLQVNEDLMRHLASTMSVKLSMVQPPLGGAKCGICYEARLPDSRDVLYRVVRAFAPFLRTCWATGSDLGTDWNDIVAACRDEANVPHPQYALMKAYGGTDVDTIGSGIQRLARGTSLVVDPSADLTMSNAVTGWTVCAATEEALRSRGESIKGKRVAIQGFGAVGGSAAKFLSEAGALVVAISDERGAVIARNNDVLNIASLLRLREEPGRKVMSRERIQSLYGYQFIERDDVLYRPVDILIPAAGSNVPIDVDQVQAKYIIEAANDPFSQETEELLFRKGITFVPDAVANAGNAGLFGLLVLDSVPSTKENIFASLKDQVQKMTRRVLENPGVNPRRALRDIARNLIRTTIEEGHSFLPNGLDTAEFARLETEHLQIAYHPDCPYLGHALDQTSRAPFGHVA